MEIAEHFYADDPATGHPDVRTRLPGTEYYFLGNGYVQAAVQICRSGEGTPLGLLIMDPDRFGPKRSALTCDPELGLEGTVVGVERGGATHRPHPKNLQAEWDTRGNLPAVLVTWQAGEVQVQERFFCPESRLPRIVREMRVEAGATDPGPLVRLLGGGPSADPPPIRGDAGGGTATIFYDLVGESGEARVEARRATEEERGFGALSHAPGPGPAADADLYWSSLAGFRTSHHGLNHLFRAARNQLPTAVDRGGRMDGGIWQYNLEWVRDQAHVAEALARLGDHAKARTILARLLDEFASAEGDTVDSGRRRPTAEVELDQNGTLLSALATYLAWTGDRELVEARWDRIRAVAAFPLQDRFLHSPSGLLHNQREYWERHAGHGIQDGFELMSQFAVAMGLDAAAGMADFLGRHEDRGLWAGAAAALKHAILEHPRFRLVEEGHLIKRRGVDGAWQRTIRTSLDLGLPPGTPLLEDGPHLLDPDTSSVLPIAHAFIPPRGELARTTLAHVEELWNQSWEGGGYGRYHTSSEPDSPGAWPFASLFVARAYSEAGAGDRVLRILEWLLNTQGGRAGSWFENDGPRVSPPYPQVGITPWTWAEMITLCVHHLLGVRPDLHGITLRPHLLEGVTSMEASLRLRAHHLHLVVRPAPSPEARGATANGEDLPWEDEGVRLPFPHSDLRVEVLC
ncbi:MAG: hypothetical protein ABIF09_06970 [Gemmatimonadota bacterium]